MLEMVSINHGKLNPLFFSLINTVHCATEPNRSLISANHFVNANQAAMMLNSCKPYF